MNKSKANEKENDDNLFQFACLGNSGVGKSSFLNLLCATLLGTNRKKKGKVQKLLSKIKKKKLFEVGEHRVSCTSEAKYLKMGNYKLWDFPGLNDTSHRDCEFIQLILKNFQANQINAIALVHNIAEERLGDSEAYFIDKICKMFPSPNVWKNIILVFTHCDKPQTLRKGRSEAGPEISRMILDIVKNYFPNIKSTIKQLPCYFFDAEIDDETDTYKEEAFTEAYHLLQTIDDFPKIKTVAFNRIVMKEHEPISQTRIETDFVYEKDVSTAAKLKRAACHTLFAFGHLGNFITGIGCKIGSLITKDKYKEEELSKEGDYWFNPVAQHNGIANAGKVKYLVTYKVTYDLITIDYSDGTSDTFESNVVRTEIKREEKDKYFDITEDLS